MPVVLASVHQLTELPVGRDTHLAVTLIARRSVQRAGTRHWRRGADPEVRARATTLNPSPCPANRILSTLCRVEAIGWVCMVHGFANHCESRNLQQDSRLLVCAQGAVANFVETEQLVEVRGPDGGVAVSSLVQVRGSIPLLWSQRPNLKYKPTTHVAPPEAYGPAFQRHARGMLEQYKVLPCGWMALYALCLCPD